VRVTGKPPEAPCDPNVPTFGAVVEECKQAGGPNATWNNGRDPGVHEQLNYVVNVVGSHHH
jgi:hypothetical protein